MCSGTVYPDPNYVLHFIAGGVQVLLQSVECDSWWEVLNLFIMIKESRVTVHTYSLDIDSSIEDNLWKLVRPKPPLEPEPLKQLQTQPIAGNTHCFAMNKESKYTHN